MSETQGAKLGAKLGAQRAAQAAWVALFAFAAVVAASSFALTYHGLHGYGLYLARLGDLAWVVPVAVDGATLFAIAATFLLAQAPIQVRVYAWLVFAVANGASIAGNLAFAGYLHLEWQGGVGAAAWPILVTLVAHLGVVTWRHCVPGSGAPATSKPRPAAPAPQAASPAPLAGPTATPTATPAQKAPVAPARGRRGRPGGGRATPQQRAEALALIDEGKRPAEAAPVVGVSKRTVQVWRKERDEAAATSPSVAVRPGVGQTPDTRPQPAPTGTPDRILAHSGAPDTRPDTDTRHLANHRT